MSQSNDPAATAKKPWWRRWFGSRSERAAKQFLSKLGYRIVARNWRCKLGELDLVAVDGDCVVFVEVRSTGGDQPDRPAESVDRLKQERLTKLAVAFMQAKRLLGRPARFDVLAVHWPADKKEPKITHYPNAFKAVGRFQMFS